MNRSSSLFSKCILCLASSLASLALLEGFVRVYIPVRNVGPSFTQYDGQYGKVLKPNTSTVRSSPEFTMTLTTNAHGFRGPPLSRPPEGSILFLGDSFTMGYGVSDGQEFPALVRAHYAQSSACEVINAGIGASGSGRALKFLRDQAASYSPQVVVVQIHDNDFDDNLHEHLFSLLEDGSLKECPPPAPSFGRNCQSFVERVPGLPHLHLIGLVRELRLIRSGCRTPGCVADPHEAKRREQQARELFLRIHTEIIAVTRKAGWQQLVVLADLPEPRANLLKHFFARSNIPTVSVPSKQKRPDLYFEVDGHWNRRGHVYTAAQVIDALDDLFPKS